MQLGKIHLVRLLLELVVDSTLITLANHKIYTQLSEPIKTEVITCRCRQARENVCERITIGYGFTSDWMKIWREFLSQS